MEAQRTIFDLPAWRSYLAVQCRLHWRDIVIAFILMTAGGVASYLSAHQIDPVIYFNGEQTGNMWFEADFPRVFANMTDRLSNHYRTKVHPLFSLIAFPPVFVLAKVFGIDLISAVIIVISAVACLWVGALFSVLRLMGCHRFDAVLFTLLGAVSSAAFFWLAVPETYSFGSLSILLALNFAVLTQYRRFSPIWHVVVSAITLSITVTNWMVGMLVTVFNHSWKQSLKITVNTFCLVTLLWSVQKFIFPSAQFFLGDKEERKYVVFSGPLPAIKSFIAHTMVMPTLNIVDNMNRPDWPKLLTQLSTPGSGNLWGMIAVGLWTALLALGLWGFFSVNKNPKLRMVLGFTLLGQLLLHSVYGSETFLYALHFIPLLLILAAMSTLTRARFLALILAGALMLTAGLNNSLKFKQATDFLLVSGTPRHQVQAQMQQRPLDPWPRGTGHILLATPGSLEKDKAYLEPGGSFSPNVGSFGISIWMVDRQGNITTTSDSFPLDQIDQTLEPIDGQTMPEVLTTTPNYQASWHSTDPGIWRLRLKSAAEADANPMIAIRSVGPAGGEIHSLNWDNQRLLINDRWAVTLDPAPIAVTLGEEGVDDWLSDRSAATQWTGSNGWGFASLALGDSDEWTVTVEDAVMPPGVELRTANTRSTLELDLPDGQFVDSLNAQVSHMLMGLVGRQTRPGEPTKYPLAWQRDGAYELAALARAGHLEVAKELSTYFAEHDFFGGFGSEADALGLSIWALEEVAARLNEPEFDQWLWPHIRRKAEFIVEMRSTDRPIHQPMAGPIVPAMRQRLYEEMTLVADPAQDGLIVGRMDHHRPLLFVNAVSYRGLLDAASMAERVNQPADAERWRTEAAEIQEAWEKAFNPPESNNPRTYISGLWPTWVAASHQDEFLQGLQERWTKLRDEQGAFVETPLWTYFDIAEAHQWLFLGDSQRVWRTLHWFWEHQASPGLYTWWEGDGVEKALGRWDYIRGWVNPPHVTPYYWTAAEMLLLQLDMLAYIEPSTPEPTLVIGAGIPVEWLDQPMKVKGLSTLVNQVDWMWDGQAMQVQVRGGQMKVKLGSAFPANTPLQVDYLDAQ